MKQVIVWFWLGMLTLSLWGCSMPTLGPIGSAGATLRTRSAFDPSITFQGQFDTALYGYDTENAIKIILFEGPVDHPTQACIIRLLWLPKAALTPIAPDATNATIQLIVFEPGDNPDAREVGVYSGAGYLFLKQKPGRARVAAAIWQATLALTDATHAFDDRLGESQLTGKLIIQRDDDRIGLLTHQLNAMVSQRLGYPRLVSAPGSSPALTFSY